MKKLSVILKVSVISICGLAFVSNAAAQADYPNKPIRLIVPPAGGANDSAARIIAPAASKRLGQPVVIENVGGAAGIPGATRVAKLPGDGYNLLQCNTTTVVANEFVFNNLPYDPANDFVPVAKNTVQAMIMAVPASSPAKNLTDFVEMWKAGKISKYGSPGPGTVTHLVGERLKIVVGRDLKHVPFPPGPQSTLALGRGEIDALFYTLPVFQPGLQAGTIRLIGIASPERSALTPDLPTMREQGFDVVMEAWNGICAPKDTPKAIVDKLFRAFTDATDDPEIVKQLNASGNDAATSKSAEDFADFIGKERVSYKELVAKAGVPKT